MDLYRINVAAFYCILYIDNERKAKDSGLMIIFIPAICAITLLVFFLFVIVCMVVFVRKRNKEKERLMKLLHKWHGLEEFF